MLFSAKKITNRTHTLKIRVSSFLTRVSKRVFFIVTALAQLCTMAKDIEKQIAKTLYIDECLTAKEISTKTNTSEKTIGKWIEDGEWKKLKLAKQSSAETLIIKYQKLLETLVDKRIAIENGEQMGDSKRTIDDISKINKAIETLTKKGKPSLGTYIHCIEKFMTALHKNNPELFFKLLDFQKEHIQIVAAEK